MNSAQLPTAVQRVLQQAPCRSANKILATDEVSLVLARERSRADRENTPLCLLLIQIIPDRECSFDFAEFERLILNRKRITDDAFKISTQFYGLVLPSTSADGARTIAADLKLQYSNKLTCTVLKYPNDWPNFDESSPNDPFGETQSGGGGVETEVALEPLFFQQLSPLKRFRDIVLSVIAIIALSPLIACAAAAIKFNSRGPVFYSQQRVGKNGVPFVMYKFRSMVVGAEELKTSLLSQNEQDGPAFKMSNDPRVTMIGRFLRKLSIDEIPQLWNVLKGEMTLVGPRPLLVDEIAACDPWQKHRLSVVPGITCTWQVDGRSQVTFADWMRMDVRYVRDAKPFRDTLILLKTIRAVLIRPNGK
jgi:lipopolysaccharide/colanic/teichoic acid biosynthesis glycosyltransferase